MLCREGWKDCARVKAEGPKLVEVRVVSKVDWTVLVMPSFKTRRRVISVRPLCGNMREARGQAMLYDP